jgi:hypothetical protein
LEAGTKHSKTQAGLVEKKDEGYGRGGEKGEKAKRIQQEG